MWNESCLLSLCQKKYFSIDVIFLAFFHLSLREERRNSSFAKEIRNMRWHICFICSAREPGLAINKHEILRVNVRLTSVLLCESWFRV